MLHLMKLFLCLCLSAIMSGCPFLATIFGYSALEGYSLLTAPDTVQTAIHVEQPIGFATLKGDFDLTKADRNEGLKLMSDDFCILYGTYAGYTGSDGIFVPEQIPSVAGAGVDTARTYQGTWGQLHAGSLLGGTKSTNYKDYFVESVLGMNSADFVKQNDSIVDGVVYEYYSARNASQGQDYMLKLYYNTDRTGAVYLYGVRDYTVSNQPVLDAFSFTGFAPDKSFALNSEIADFTGGGSGGTSLFNVEEYSGEWDSGIVTIDGVEYNLHAQNMRTLESQGVEVFDDRYSEQGYDTPTKGGKADVQCLFGGRRLITLHLELKSESTSVLRDAKVTGFVIGISNNYVTDEEHTHGSYGIHPQGQVVNEQGFVDTYYPGAPYYVTQGGKTHYYTADGTEITREEYRAILSGEKIETSSTTTEDTSEEGSEETSEDTSEETSEEASEETSEEGTEETSEPTSEEPVSGGTGFGGVGTHTEENDVESELANGDWFVIGGLHSEVTLASLESYLQKYATSVTTAGAGSNSTKYIVKRGSATMTFTLEKNTTISDMEVKYEDG